MTAIIQIMSSENATITPVEDPDPRGQHPKDKGKRPANLIIFSHPPPQKGKRQLKKKSLTAFSVNVIQFLLKNSISVNQISTSEYSHVYEN